jgi:tetratricopeptide (TPR) repeat protein
MGWFKSKDPRALEAAQAAYDQDRFADAVELCNQALDRAASLVELCLLRGKALHGLEDFQQAVTDFDYCLLHDPCCEQAYLWRANALAALGQWSRAYEDLSRRIALEPTNPEFHYGRARLLFDGGKFSEAGQDLTRAIALNPREHDYYCLRAGCARWEGHFEFALTDCQRAIELRAECPETWKIRAACHIGLGELDAAQHAFAQAISLAPQDADPCMALARIYQQVDDLPRALQYATLAIDRCQGDCAGDFLEFRASLYAVQQRWDLAESDIRQAIQFDPGRKDYYSFRGYLAQRQGRDNQARADFARFHELHREELRGMSPHSQRIPGVRVQANRGLYEPGPENLPALYLISFDPRVHNNLAFLDQLADRMFDLEEYTSEDATLDAVARIGLRNQVMAEPGRRTKLPPSFTGGADVFAVDLIIYRPYLPQGYLTKRSLMCLAEPGNEGWTEHIPETVP